MFDIASTELFLIAVIALLVIGPKELPQAMRFVGTWFGKARRMARSFYGAFDKIIQDTEIADLEKNWQARNDAIMRAFPTADHPEGTYPEDRAMGAPLVGEPADPPVDDKTPASPGAKDTTATPVFSNKNPTQNNKSRSLQTSSQKRGQDKELPKQVGSQ